MKRLVRLTEGDLHRIVKESVDIILSETVNEGQGWDTFKHHMRFGNMPGFHDDDFDEKDWIEYGNGYSPQSYRGRRTSTSYYDTRTGGPAEIRPGMEDSKYSKPINRTSSGRLGRKAALYGLKAMDKMGFKP